LKKEDRRWKINDGCLILDRKKRGQPQGCLLHLQIRFYPPLVLRPKQAVQGF